MKRVFLADGEIHVLEALHLLFEQQPDYEILGEARSAESLLAHACKVSPDAILLDWDLPGFHPQRLIPALRECCQSAKLVALSVKPEHEKIAKGYGVDGFVSKQLPPEAFLDSLNTIIEQAKTKKGEPMKTISIVAAIILILHGLIHLMGTVTYMKLGTVQGLTYKTTLLGGRWDLGEGGISVYGALWAVATIGFIVSAIALLAGWGWYRPVLMGVAVFSFALTALDWKVASVGAILNIVILAWLSFVPDIVK